MRKYRKRIHYTETDKALMLFCVSRSSLPNWAISRSTSRLPADLIPCLSEFWLDLALPCAWAEILAILHFSGMTQNL